MSKPFISSVSVFLLRTRLRRNCLLTRPARQRPRIETFYEYVLSDNTRSNGYYPWLFHMDNEFHIHVPYYWMPRGLRSQPRGKGPYHVRTPPVRPKGVSSREPRDPLSFCCEPNESRPSCHLHGSSPISFHMPFVIMIFVYPLIWRLWKYNP